MAPDGCDAQYPIRQDWVCDWIKSGEQNAAKLLKAIKGRLPYLHADYKDLIISVPKDCMTARDLLRTIAQELPGWQTTAFPSHMT
jgi:hypothetical protein